MLTLRHAQLSWQVQDPTCIDQVHHTIKVGNSENLHFRILWIWSPLWMDFRRPSNCCKPCFIADGAKPRKNYFHACLFYFQWSNHFHQATMSDFQVLCVKVGDGGPIRPIMEEAFRVKSSLYWACRDIFFLCISYLFSFFYVHVFSILHWNLTN